ncbi:hypothetical protein MKK70_22090 [Methylobacterium sp. E-041]|uniref:hypothetical protein n=1 Tax=Methylobacterium sp. E-041 TaxID=2836573 RepID=UPI001FBA7AA1|nr:hypothetical protein [Methylobacterium sp. E-041]MCJ2108015.1 hypothetical protein [Methylobacterium sp. E-041]
MRLVRRALALLLTLNLAFPAGLVPAQARTLFDPAGAGKLYPLSSAATASTAVSFLPDLVYSIDPSAPTSYADLPAGTPGVKIDGFNNVVALNERVSGLKLTGNQKAVFTASGGPAGLPYLSAKSDALYYDTLTLPPSEADQFVAVAGQPWSLTAVLRQSTTLGNQNEILKITDGSTYITVGPVSSSGTTRALQAGQNNGAATAVENLALVGNLVPAQGTWGILQVICDGSRFYILRNGLVTAASPAGTVGNLGAGKATQFEFLNNSRADIALLELTRSAPSAAQVAAEVARLSVKYRITTQDVTQAFAYVPPLPIPPIDFTQQWLQSPNWPTKAPPVDASAVPSTGIALLSGTTNVESIVFGTAPNANIRNQTQYNEISFSNSIFGDQSSVVSTGPNNPSDGVQTSYGRHRLYPEFKSDGVTPHPARLIEFLPEGVKLLSRGIKNNTVPYTKGNLYSAVFRDQLNILPGSYIEVKFRGPTVAQAWPPIWLEQAYQASPKRVAAANGNPYYNYGTANALTADMKFTVNGTVEKPYYEIDNGDFFQRPDLAPSGTLLTSGIVPGTNPSTRTFDPYTSFVANDNGFTFIPNNGYPYAALTGGATIFDGIHTLGVHLKRDGTVQYIWDGKLFLQQHQQFLSDTFTDQIDGVVKQIGYHLKIGGQAVPDFIAPASTDGTAPVGPFDPSAMAITVQSIRTWVAPANQNEVIADSSIVKPANAIAQYSALTLSNASPPPGSVWTATINNRTAGTRITATSSDGTVLTVSGSTVSGTFPSAAGAPTLTLVEQPQKPAGGNPIPNGIPRTTTIPLNIVARGPNDINAQSPNNLAASQVASGNTQALTFTAGQASPDGYNNAVRLLASATNDYHRLHLTRNAGNSTALVPGQTYTFQFYAKSVGGHQWLLANKLIAGTGPVVSLDVLNCAVGAQAASPNTPVTVTATQVTGYTGWCKFTETFVAPSGVNYMDGYLHLNPGAGATESGFTGTGGTGVDVFDVAHF